MWRRPALATAHSQMHAPGGGGRQPNRGGGGRAAAAPTRARRGRRRRRGRSLPPRRCVARSPAPGNGIKRVKWTSGGVARRAAARGRAQSGGQRRVLQKAWPKQNGRPSALQPRRRPKCAPRGDEGTTHATHRSASGERHDGLSVGGEGKNQETSVRWFACTLLPRSSDTQVPSPSHTHTPPTPASRNGHCSRHHATLSTACRRHPQRFILQLQRPHACRQHCLPPTRSSRRVLGSDHLPASGSSIV